MPAGISRRPALGTYLAVTFSALCIVLTLVLTFIIERSAAQHVGTSIGARMADVARLTALRLDRGLFERHREIQLLSRRLPQLDDPAQVRRELDAARETFRYYAWLGVTDMQGRVEVASGRLLEGVDVSQRPWFRGALEGIHLQDVHPAVLLASALGDRAPVPPRFFDVAFPLREGGTTGGVLGAHVSWSWAEDILQVVRASREGSELEPVILASEGTVLLGPADLIGTKLDLESVRRVAAGQEGYVLEEWPDGERYLVGYSPTKGFLSSPGLGWRVLVRQNLDEANGPVRAMQWRLVVGGIVLALIFSWLGWWTAREVTRPVLELADEARRLEQGAATGVRDAREYREVETLSDALNSLVRNLKQKEAELSQLNTELEQRVRERTQELSEALERSSTDQRRIQTIIESAHDPFVGMDLSGRIIDWNSRAESLFGWTRQEAIGRRVHDTLLRPQEAEGFDRWLDEVKDTGGVQGVDRPIERVVRDRHGREIPVELRIGLVATGEQRFFGAFIQDISERKAVERMKDEFVSTVSHELRTPLTAIYGSLSLVNSGMAGELAPDVRSLLSICQDSTERLVRLINEMLDVDKMASGKLEYRMQPQPLRPLVEQAVRDTRAYADSLGVPLEFVPGPDATVQVDADRIVQVCVNLLSNAAKFSPPGQPVQVQLTVQDQSVRVSVIDAGPGIPAQFRDRLFERFAQADASDRRAKGGTGLGLAICRGIVEAHGGRIDFDSEPGVRTEFFFELPLPADAA